METPEFLIKEAEKALATSFFKRKPDHDSAAMFYGKAAKKLQYNKSYEEAISAYLKESKEYEISDSIYMAAKAIENVAYIYSTFLKNPKEAGVFYEKCARLYLVNNNLERATESLEKAGKAVVDTSISSAIQYFKQACELYEQEERYRQGLDTYTSTIALCIRDKQMDTAIKLSHKQIEILQKLRTSESYDHLLCKAYLSHLILVLSLGDVVEASKQLQNFISHTSNFVSSDEGNISVQLLNAFEQRDQNLLVETTKRQHVTFLHIEIVKLAR